jgi:hypothetical protein
VSCSANRVVPGAHRVVGPGTHRGSGPREVHTTVSEPGLCSFWSGSLTYRWYVVVVDWIFYFLHSLIISISHKGLKLERVDYRMWPKRLVRVPSLLCIRHVPTGWNHHKGLTVCIFSRLNQQIKVMCRCDLLRCKRCTIKWKLRHYEWLRFGVMRSLRWDFQRDSIDAIYVILWGFQGASLIPPLLPSIAAS